MFGLEKLLCLGVLVLFLDTLVTWYGEAAFSFSSYLRDLQGEGGGVWFHGGRRGGGTGISTLKRNPSPLNHQPPILPCPQV